MPPSTYRQVTCLFAFVFALGGLIRPYAQQLDEKNFTLYTTKEGLSSNRITDIKQDKYGYLWISTHEGLNRFDGSSFQTFYADSTRNSLPRDELIKLKWLDDEQLAASTIGLHIVNIRTLASRNIIIPAGQLKYEYNVNSVEDVLSDQAGNIYILTRSGFYQYHNNELIFRFDYYNEPQTIIFQFGRRMIRVDNSILLATFGGLYVYNIIKKEIHPVSSADDTFFQQIAGPREWFWFMHGDQQSFSVQMEGASALHYYDIKNRKKILIWPPFTTIDKFDWRSRLFYLNDSTYAINGMRKGFYLIQYQKEKGRFEIKPGLYFKNNFCSSLFIDKDQRLWIATSEGLFAEKKLSSYIETIPVPQELNPFGKDLYISSFTAANDKLFAGTNTGMLVFDRATLRPLKRIPLFGTDGGYVPSTITANTDTVLASAVHHLSWINSKNLKSGKYELPPMDKGVELISLLIDSDDGIFFTINSPFRFLYRRSPVSGFKKMNFAGNKFFRILSPVHVAMDPEGNIWFGGHGLSRYNPQKETFDFMIDSFPVFKMARKEVTSPIFVNRKMYFGVAENGLLIYDLDKNKFEQFTRENGLPNNTVEALYHFKDKIWLATDKGLASFDLATHAISTFGVRDNMPSEPFTGRSLFYDSIYHYLYAGFNNTIVRFNPGKLMKNNLPPSFFIENINLSGRRTLYHPKDKITLSYKENNLVINLASINYEDAYQQQFAYRFLKDGNEPWQEIGTQRSIIVGNLSAGTQRLQVKVFIRNNTWPEQISELVINIRPPFWKTTWFILLAGTIFLAILYFLYRLRIKNIRQKANIDKQLAELEMKGLHAQMNPHFIFNSLNSIKEMILEDEKQNASRYLSKFAQLIRTSLEQSRQTFISVKQCIDHLQQYLEMEKIRFDSFSYSIDVDDELATDDIQMAPMLVQPLVENAIWHGLNNKKGDKRLTIRFYKSGEQLICEIGDNGIGIKQSKENKSNQRSVHRSLGISNIHERLAVLNGKYKMSCSLTINDKSELPEQEGSGTLVMLRLSI